MPSDSRFVLDNRFATKPSSAEQSDAGSSTHSDYELDEPDNAASEAEFEQDDEHAPEGMDAEGLAGPSKTVKPLTKEALEAYNKAQERTGVIYISRIPPGMRPTKVRHLMSQHGEIGRVYLQQEDAKRAYLRRKHTSTKKAHFTEGWVEFKDKKVARAVASMMNAQPIGGKKGTRWRDDIWTMKYLPRFKWDMLTEQIAHEAAQRTARLRVELNQSRAEQREYLKNVELARVLDKRVKRKQDEAEKAGLDPSTVTLPVRPEKRQRKEGDEGGRGKMKKGARKQQYAATPHNSRPDLEHVLDNIF